VNNFLNSLRRLGLDEDIILELLGTGKSNWHTHSELGRIYYRDSETEKAFFEVKIRNGSIAELKLGPACDDNLLNNILSFANELVHPTSGFSVLSRILLSDAEPKGQFFYQDKFRIRPALQDINVSSGLDWFENTQGNMFDHIGYKAYGPPYPLLLEVKVPNHSVHRLHRVLGLKALDEYQNLVSLLVRGVRPLKANAMQRQWVAIRPQSSTQNEYHLVSPSIFIRSDAVSVPWLDVGESRMPEIPDAEYHDRLPSSLPSEVSLSCKTRERVDRYEKLVGLNKKSLNRSAYWFATGLGQVGDVSASLVSYATAIECLLSEPVGHPCDKCGKPTGEGPTQKFKKFLEKYAPVSNGLKSHRKKIYDVRSLLVHGRFASEVDVLGQSLMRDETSPVLVPWLVRKALCNWLSISE
jgi:Apea-like HEPN